MPTFTHALTEQPQAGFWLYGPEIFRTYCRRHGLLADTAATISVGHARYLSKELRDAHTMVLRLGTGHGDDDVRGQTAFALIRHESHHDGFREPRFSKAALWQHQDAAVQSLPRGSEPLKTTLILVQLCI